MDLNYIKTPHFSTLMTKCINGLKIMSQNLNKNLSFRSKAICGIILVAIILVNLTSAIIGFVLGVVVGIKSTKHNKGTKWNNETE